jgi:hypothetical protein
MYLFRGMYRPVFGQVKGDLEREPGPVNLRQLEHTKSVTFMCFLVFGSVTF